LALDPKVRKDEDRYLDGLVKGITFIGTPFWGSFNALTIVPYIKILGKYNRHHKSADLVASLRANDAELSNLVAHFSQIRSQHDIDIKIFYESLVVGTSLVSFLLVASQFLQYAQYFLVDFYISFSSPYI
jgi:hypothetical protein